MNCPECRSTLPLEANFCHKCGQPLNSMAQEPTLNVSLVAERKRVSALFSDLSGYTAMTEILDPEIVKEITSRIFDGVTDIIAKYEGFIERFEGDGILALFGVPVTYEDHPIRATQAAIEIHKLVDAVSPDYEHKLGYKISMHSGINTGLAVTADANPKGKTYGITGDAVNVADRLSNMAKAGEILVGYDTHKAIKNQFTFKELPPRELKGKSDLVKAYRLLYTRHSKPQLVRSRQVSSKLVGRDQEMISLEFQVMKALNGQGSVVNIIGEEGIGKSRLIAELKRRDCMKHVTLFEGRARSIGKNLSFHPINDILRQWARIGEDDSEVEALNNLISAVRKVYPEETDEIVPFIATMMSMKVAEVYAERLKGIEGESLETMIQISLRKLLIKASESTPLVIIVEDLHWADKSSLDLLISLLPLAKTCKIVFINIYRFGHIETGERIYSYSKETLSQHFVAIYLQALDAKMSEVLINNMVKISKQYHPIIDQIVKRAGGNPFFIEEVVRTFIDEKAIDVIDGVFEATPKIYQMYVPNTIKDVLMARIDRLDEDTRSLLKVASVIGRTFYHKILVEVVNSNQSVKLDLAKLKEVQLIRERRRMGEIEYIFKHAIAQEVIYESILIQERRQLHLKVANAIERTFNDNLHYFYGLLSHHYSLGDNINKAEEYMFKAGEEAMKASASNEALYYFQGTLKLYLEKRKKEFDKDRISQLEESIANAFLNKGHFTHAIEWFEKLFEDRGFPFAQRKMFMSWKIVYSILVIMWKLNITYGFKKLTPTKSDEDFFRLNIRYSKALVQTDMEKGFTHNIKMLKKALNYDISRSKIFFDMVSGSSALFSLSGISEKISHDLLRYSERYNNNKNDLNFIYMYKLAETIHCFLFGQWGKVSYDKQLIENALRVGDQVVFGNLTWIGLAKLELGDFNTCLEILERFTEINNQIDNDDSLLNMYDLKTKLLLKQGNTKEAMGTANEVIALSKKVGFEMKIVQYLGIIAKIYIIDNSLEEAGKALTEAEIITNRIGIRSIFTNYYGDYFISKYLYSLSLLEISLKKKNSLKIKKHTKIAFKLGKDAVRHSKKKVAANRTEAYRLMGRYFWLINKHGRALKWYLRSIVEGKSLGASVELSRTYFEVGIRLMDTRSQIKALDGRQGKHYIERAKAMFRDMKLIWDLEHLDNITQLNEKYIIK